MSQTYSAKPVANQNGILLKERSKNQPAPVRSFEHHGAYAVLAPDPSKRNKVLQVAEKEAQAYEQFKKQRRMEYIKFEGTPGGDQTIGTSELGSGAKNSKRTSSLLKTVPPLRAKKTTQMSAPSKEEMDAETHKAKQRAKAEQQDMRQSERKERLDADRRAKNEEFLKKLTQRK